MPRPSPLTEWRSRIVGRLPSRFAPEESYLSLVLRFLANQGLLVVIVIFGIVMWQLSDVFLTEINLINVLYQTTILAVYALGMTFVLLTAGIDVSVGAVATVSSVLAIGMVVNYGLPTEVGILVALAAGAGVGILNGVAVTKIGINALIVTLASLSIATGFAFAYTNGANLTPVPEVYVWAGTTKIGSLPVMIPFVLALAVVAHIVLTRTRFGRSVYAVGGNPVAARLSGIRTDRILISVYAICGLAAALAGLMMTARLQSGSPRAGGDPLTVIAATVIGGTSLFGGIGNVKGTLFGALLITMVTNAINLLGVPSAYDQLVMGAIIFVAAALDVYRYRFTERRLSRMARATTTSRPDGAVRAAGAVAENGFADLIATSEKKGGVG